MKTLAMIAAFSVMMAAKLAVAQPLPAEVPPADYSGRDYVDSRGCTFQRLVFNGTVAWVALLGADGAQVCTPVAAEPQASPPAEGAAPEKASAPEVKDGPKPAVSPALPKGYWVQVGAFRQAANAERTVAQLKELGFPTLTWPAKAGQLTAALAGPFADRSAAGEAQRVLLARFPQAFLRP